MDAEQIVMLVGAGGGGAVLLALVKGIFDWLSGSAGRERDRDSGLVAQRTLAVERAVKAEARADRAFEKRDEEAEKRREAEEHVAILQFQLRALGVNPMERPERDEELPYGRS